MSDAVVRDVVELGQVDGWRVYEPVPYRPLEIERTEASIPDAPVWRLQGPGEEPGLLHWCAVCGEACRRFNDRVTAERYVRLMNRALAEQAAQAEHEVRPVRFRWEAIPGRVYVDGDPDLTGDETWTWGGVLAVSAGVLLAAVLVFALVTGAIVLVASLTHGVHASSAAAAWHELAGRVRY